MTGIHVEVLIWAGLAASSRPPRAQAVLAKPAVRGRARVLARHGQRARGGILAISASPALYGGKDGGRLESFGSDVRIRCYHFPREYPTILSSGPDQVTIWNLIGRKAAERQQRWFSELLRHTHVSPQVLRSPPAIRDTDPQGPTETRYLWLLMAHIHIYVLQYEHIIILSSLPVPRRTQFFSPQGRHGEDATSR